MLYIQTFVICFVFFFFFCCCCCCFCCFCYFICEYAHPPTPTIRTTATMMTTRTRSVTMMMVFSFVSLRISECGWYGGRSGCGDGGTWMTAIKKQWRWQRWKNISIGINLMGKWDVYVWVCLCLCLQCDPCQKYSCKQHFVPIMAHSLTKTYILKSETVKQKYCSWKQCFKMKI